MDRAKAESGVFSILSVSFPLLQISVEAALLVYGIRSDSVDVVCTFIPLLNLINKECLIVFQYGISHYHTGISGPITDLSK